jgi:hypothetical protein
MNNFGWTISTTTSTIREEKRREEKRREEKRREEKRREVLSG